MLGHFPARRATIQKLPGRCYLALRHHPLSPRHPTELAGGLQSGASAFNGQIPLNLAPTASTTAQLALGDALAVALLDARGFGPDDFARTHPGGVLGRKLLTHVADVMRVGDAVPRVAGSAPFPAALLEMTRKGLGMTAVVDDAGALRGVITDGDLRRLLERGVDLRALTAGQAMHPDPRTIRPDALAVEAVQMMEQYRINQMLVVDANKQPIGALNMHDLFAAKVV